MFSIGWNLTDFSYEHTYLLKSAHHGRMNRASHFLEEFYVCSNDVEQETRRKRLYFYHENNHERR
jgi:hypothetical protein